MAAFFYFSDADRFWLEGKTAPFQETPEGSARERLAPGAGGVTLAAVGDVMLARKVGRLIEQKGTDYPLAELGKELRQYDVAFANLESPISQKGWPLPGKALCFRAHPRTVNSLLAGGIDIVSLANNHAVDYDSPALLETIELLQNAGIAAVGAGSSIDQARRPAVLEREGIRLAFLAYSDLADVYFSTKYKRPARASADRPGVAPLDMAMMLEDVAYASTQADYVIVSVHWGTEYTSQPAAAQVEMAHSLIDAGADVIIGHHPHWLQGIEVYKGGIIAYSLGNFVFDQNWSDETREGLVLEVVFSRGRPLQARARPVWIAESQPVWAEGERGERLRKFLVKLSGDLSTPATVIGDWVEYRAAN